MCKAAETKWNNGGMLLTGENRNIPRNFAVADCVKTTTTSGKRSDTVKREILLVAHNILSVLNKLMLNSIVLVDEASR